MKGSVSTSPVDGLKTPMELSKTPGTAAKTSISPSRALLNEAHRQVENGMWDSTTEFFEASAWLMVEMQTLGVDLLDAEPTDDDDKPSPKLRESHAQLGLTITDSQSQTHDDAE